MKKQPRLIRYALDESKTVLIDGTKCYYAVYVEVYEYGSYVRTMFFRDLRVRGGLLDRIMGREREVPNVMFTIDRDIRSTQHTKEEMRKIVMTAYERSGLSRRRAEEIMRGELI